jgi:4-hydroxybenzoate polyprenyltransferase
MPTAMSYAIGNLVVVLAALSLSETTVWWFGGGHGWGLLTLIGGVIAAYSLDRLIDAAGSERRRVLLRFGPALLVGCALVASGLIKVPGHLLLVMLLAVMGGAYVPLKRVVPKGVLTAGAWAIAVVWLPGAQAPTIASGWPVAVCVFLIVSANAILCDALDVEIDRAKGVRGLAPWLGARRASLVAAMLACGGGVLAVLHGPWPLAVAAGALGVAGVVRDVPRGVDLRRTALDLVLVLPGMVVLWLGPR